MPLFTPTHALVPAVSSRYCRLIVASRSDGSAFIGGALVALMPMQFHDLFEVVPDTERSDPS